MPLLYTPGAAWGYSLGIDVLGGVVEAVCEQSLAVAVAVDELVSASMKAKPVPS